MSNEVATSTDYVISEDDDGLVIEFLQKSYTDEDVYHILPQVTPELLLELKTQHCDTIIRGMRDYALVRKNSDDKMDYLESIALEKLELAMAFEMDPLKLLKIFQSLNSAKRRSEGEGKPATSTTIHAETVVQLQMPARMLKEMASPDFQTNSNNEVIEVSGRAMATATNTQVLAQLKERQKTDLSRTPEIEDI